MRRGELDAALDAVVDIEAGLRDAMLPGRRAGLDQALDRVLDVEAGLLAIVPGAATTLAQYVHALASRPPRERLAARTETPGFDADQLRAARAATRLLGPVTNVIRLLDHPGESSGPPTTAIRRELEPLVKLDGRVGEIRSLLLVATRGHPNEAMTYARSLAETYYGDILGSLIHALGPHHVSRRDKLAVLLKRELREATSPDDFWTIIESCELLNVAFAEFAGADLSNVDLTGIPLTGVRWSSGTRWPPGWAESIRVSSVRIGPDLFEVRDTPRLDAWADQLP